MTVFGLELTMPTFSEFTRGVAIAVSVWGIFFAVGIAGKTKEELFLGLLAFLSGGVLSTFGISPTKSMKHGVVLFVAAILIQMVGQILLQLWW